MNRKFELTEKKEVGGLTLFRTKAKIAFGNVAKGELGGWIEKEGNLSDSGDAWVYGNARVYGYARVYGCAWVYGKLKLTSRLCSFYDFEFDWQVKLWHKKEEEFEAEVKRRLKKRTD